MSTNIQNWRSSNFKDPKKLHTEFVHRVQLIEVDAIKVYCLMKHFISDTPNGLYTLLGNQNKPIDNPIWWDFLLEDKDKKNKIWIWRTNSCLEASHNFVNENDLLTFLNVNIESHDEAIKQSLSTLTKHLTYINHYHSYGNILEKLWDKYNDLEVLYPDLKNNHTQDVSSNQFKKQMEQFTTTMVEKHVVGKSIVLFAAFYIESLVSTLFRVGSVGILRHDKDVHSQVIRLGFKEKLQTITFYTPLFVKKFDLSHKIFKDVFELMSLRNKYVHTDKTADINKLGEVYFDEDFPVFELSEKPFAIHNFEQTFSQPDETRIKDSYNLAMTFDEYIKSNLTDQYKDSIHILLSSNPIGFNTKLNMFSGLFGNHIIHFTMVAKK